MRVAIAHAFTGQRRVRELLAVARDACATLGDEAVELEVLSGIAVEQLLFVRGTRWTDRSSVARFHALDACVVDGEGPPWDRRNEPLYYLVSQCIAQGKPLFGGAFATAMVAFVRDTAGRPFPSLSAGTLDDLRSILPQGGATFIDVEHGTVFQGSFNGRRLRWGVIARTSIRINEHGWRKRQRRRQRPSPATTAATTAATAATTASAREESPSIAPEPHRRPHSASTSRSDTCATGPTSSSDSGSRRAGDAEAHVVPRFAAHPLLRLLPQPRFVVGSTYGWDVERAWATRVGASTLVDSGPRPMVLLLHHAVLLLFDLRPRYPQARFLLGAFLTLCLAQDRERRPSEEGSSEAGQVGPDANRAASRHHRGERAVSAWGGHEEVSPPCVRPSTAAAGGAPGARWGARPMSASPSLQRVRANAAEDSPWAAVRRPVRPAGGLVSRSRPTTAYRAAARTGSAGQVRLPTGDRTRSARLQRRRQEARERAEAVVAALPTAGDATTSDSDSDSDRVSEGPGMSSLPAYREAVRAPTAAAAGSWRAPSPAERPSRLPTRADVPSKGTGEEEDDGGEDEEDEEGMEVPYQAVVQRRVQAVLAGSAPALPRPKHLESEADAEAIRALQRARLERGGGARGAYRRAGASEARGSGLATAASTAGSGSTAPPTSSARPQSRAEGGDRTVRVRPTGAPRRPYTAYPRHKAQQRHTLAADLASAHGVRRPAAERQAACSVARPFVSIRVDQPYVPDEARAREEEVRGRTRWVAPRDFVTAVSSSYLPPPPPPGPTVRASSPYRPPPTRFRPDEEPSRFVGPPTGFRSG